MTVKRSFAKFMEDNGFGVFNTDLFIGSVPEQAPIASWWIIGGGGSPIIKNNTGEKVKTYIMTVFYRNIDAQDVDTQIQALEEFINSKGCHNIDDYETVEMEVTGLQSEGDMDAEERTLASIEVSISVYQSI